MNVATAYGGKPARLADLKLEALYELAAPSSPHEVREEIERRIAAGEIMGAAGGPRMAKRRPTSTPSILGGLVFRNTLRPLANWRGNRQMKWVVSVIVVIITSLWATPAAIAEQKRDLTAEQLLDLCASEASAYRCHVWFSGFAGGVLVAQTLAESKTCLPDHIDWRQALNVFFDELKKHPNVAKLDAATVAFVALQDTFPCKKSK